MSEKAIDLLNDFCACICRMQKSLCTVGTRTRSNKRVRLDQDSRTKQRFRQTVNDAEMSFRHAIRQLFAYPIKDFMLESVARDTIQALQKTRKIYHIDDESYKLVLNSTVNPIIESIMVEEDISKVSEMRQESRKYFIRQLLLSSYNPEPLDPGEELELNLNETDDSGEIDILQVPPGGPSAARRLRIAIGEDQAMISNALAIIDILFDTLDQSTRTMASEKADYTSLICVITNITHIVEIPTWYLELIKAVFEKDTENGLMSRRSTMIGILQERLSKYRADVQDYIARFDADNPLIIYQMELKSLMILLLTIECLLKD